MSKLAAKPVLNFVHLKHGFICESPNEYIDTINGIYKDKTKYTSIKKESFLLFEKNYENSIIEKSLIKYFT